MAAMAAARRNRARKALLLKARQEQLDRMNIYDVGDGWPEVIPGKTLYAACYRGDIDEVSRFLTEGTEQERSGLMPKVGEEPEGEESVFFGRSPLHAACLEGNLETVKILVEEAGVSVDERTGDGRSGLHLASYYGRDAVLEYCLEKGALVNLKDNDQCTPLHYATRCRQLACVRVLIRYGADALVLDNEGNSPIRCACIRSVVSGLPISRDPMSRDLINHLCECAELNRQGMRKRIKSEKERRVLAERTLTRASKELQKVHVMAGVEPDDMEARICTLAQQAGQLDEQLQAETEREETNEGVVASLDALIAAQQALIETLKSR